MGGTFSTHNQEPTSQESTSQSEHQRAFLLAGFLDSFWGPFLRIFLLFVIGLIGVVIISFLYNLRSKNAAESIRNVLLIYFGICGILGLNYSLLYVKKFYNRLRNQRVYSNRQPSALQTTAAEIAAELGIAGLSAGLPTTEQRNDDDDNQYKTRKPQDSFFARPETPDILPGPSSDEVSNPQAENLITKCPECKKFLLKYFKQVSEKCKNCDPIDKVSKFLFYMKFRRNLNHENKGCEICEMRLNCEKGIDFVPKIERDQEKSGQATCNDCDSELNYFYDVYVPNEGLNKDNLGNIAEKNKNVYHCNICLGTFSNPHKLIHHVLTDYVYFDQ